MCSRCVIDHNGARHSLIRPRRRTEPPFRSRFDEVAVERLVSGQQVRTNRAERAAAVAKLTSYGFTARLIAERIHVSERTVERLRQSMTAA